MNTWTPDWAPDTPKRTITDTDYPFMRKCHHALLSHCEGIIAGKEAFMPVGDAHGLYPMDDHADRFHRSMYDAIETQESFSYFITEQGRVGRGACWTGERVGEGG
jgi:hypothetical protein